MKITVTISDVNPNPSNVYRVRKWGDRVLVDLLGATTALVGDNFQVVKTASLSDNGAPEFNDIARVQIVDEVYLTEIQCADEYTVESKMNWLINIDGKGVRPYWKDGGERLKFGPFVFGGQWVQLGEEITVRGDYPNKPDQWITMRRVIGLRKADMAKVSHTSHPYLIQRCTEVYGKDVYNDAPRGIIYHPVWSDEDFPVNYGDGKMWLPVEFLEAQ